MNRALPLREDEPANNKNTSGLPTFRVRLKFVCVIAVPYYECCVIRVVWHYSHIQVSMAVSIGLVHIWCQGICNHRDDQGGVTEPIFSVWLYVFFRTVKTLLIYLMIFSCLRDITRVQLWSPVYQIWMWFKESNKYYSKIENFERSFSNPYLWADLCIWECHSAHRYRCLSVYLVMYSALPTSVSEFDNVYQNM